MNLLQNKYILWEVINSLQALGLKNVISDGLFLQIFIRKIHHKIYSLFIWNIFLANMLASNVGRKLYFVRNFVNYYSPYLTRINPL